MNLDLNSFFREPDPEPQKIVTEWHEDLVAVRKHNIQLGIDMQVEVLSAVVDALKFAQLLNPIEMEQAIDDVSRIILSMQGR